MKSVSKKLPLTIIIIITDISASLYIYAKEPSP